VSPAHTGQGIGAFTDFGVDLGRPLNAKAVGVLRLLAVGGLVWGPQPDATTLADSPIVLGGCRIGSLFVLR
jgi:hypothetical protein